MMNKMQFKSPYDIRDHVAAKAQSDEAFRESLKANPRGTVEEMGGVNLPDNVSVHVHTDTDTDFHLVLPNNHLSPDELGHVRGGWDGSFADW